MNTPKAPDPVQTANMQQEYNVNAAKTQQELNQYNQSNPYGTTTYVQTGTNADGTPQYTVNTAFSAPQQKLYEGYTANQQGAQDAAAKLMASGQGAFSGKGLDLSYNGTAAKLDALNRSRLDPQWAQATDQQESKLAAQGVTPGTPAYDNAMRVFNQGKNDAYNSANLANYQTAANTALAEYNSPLTSYQALMSGTAPTNPTTGNVSTPTTNVASTNYAGLAQQNYQNQVAQNNAMMGGIFGTLGTIGGAALGGPMGASLGGSLGGLFGGGGGGGLAGGSAFNNSNMSSPFYGPLN
ncbi:hypothetical protein [Bradyrhizobium genomosp. III]|uniref:hypothetical protein n=1 Tax=Bradyrhizobium genomosp. III TaxID=2683271 RepID=UPI00057706AB|nr:hypothetical protein [Bradyrhizobium sp. CCBAU 15544]